MTTCGRCGHTVEVGRFCTNCGAPVDQDRTDTAERPAAGATGPSAPAPPPPLPSAPPSAARYPLFADELESSADDVPEPPPVVAPAPAPAGHRSAPRRGAGLLAGIAVVAVLLVVGLGGAVLLLSDGDDDERADDRGSSSTPDESSDPPSPGDSSPPSDPQPPDGLADLASSSTAEVPSTRKPGTAVDGTPIRYDAAQMLDGDPATSWQMAGDGTGSEIVLTLAQPTVLSEVGLINGYAKTDRDGRGREIDWYAGNRRILAVEWTFDDGTTVSQELEDATPTLQTVPVEAVETSTVTLRLVEVSRPGKGRDARDNTAISEIALVGASTD